MNRPNIPPTSVIYRIEDQDIVREYHRICEANVAVHRSWLDYAKTLGATAVYRAGYGSHLAGVGFPGTPGKTPPTPGLRWASRQRDVAVPALRTPEGKAIRAAMAALPESPSLDVVYKRLWANEPELAVFGERVGNGNRMRHGHPNSGILRVGPTLYLVVQPVSETDTHSTPVGCVPLKLSEFWAAWEAWEVLEAAGAAV